MSTQVLLVSDQPLYRDGVARTLGDSPDITVAGTAAGVEQALELVELRRFGRADERDPESVRESIARGRRLDDGRALGSYVAFPDLVPLRVEDREPEVVEALVVRHAI